MDSTDSLRRCAVVVTGWLLIVSVLPPNGLLWQFGAFDALGHWLANGMLAAMSLSGLAQ